MLSQAQRSAILELKAQGVSKREIARVLNISRLTVRTVLRSDSSQVPTLSRPEKAEPYRQQILELQLQREPGAGAGRILVHMEKAIASGARKAEILEACVVAIAMGGGPARVCHWYLSF